MNLHTRVLWILIGTILISSFYIVAVASKTYCSTDKHADCEDYMLYTEIIKDSTCTEPGLKSTVCNKCNYRLKDEEIDVKNHEYTELEILEQPYKGKNGVRKKQCKLCNLIVQEEFECEHNFSEWYTISNPYLNTNGLEERQCIKCELPEVREFECLHEFGNWKVIEKPSIDNNGIGVQKRECSICYISERKQIECDHTLTYSDTIKEATCDDIGIAEIRCVDCNRFITQTEIQPYGHKFSSWKSVIKATPLNHGLDQRTCQCGAKEEIETTWKNKWEDMVYFPTAGIEHEIVNGKWKQAYIDAFDIVVNYTRLSQWEPMILGHDYGPFGKIYKLKEGDHLFYFHEGYLRVFKVTLSEVAWWYAEPFKRYLVGKKSGISVFDRVSDEALHMYTCYGDDIWMVVATRDLEAEKNIVGDFKLGLTLEKWRSNDYEYVEDFSDIAPLPN